jgi:hypothetical protein
MDAGIVDVGDGDETMVAVGSKPGAESVAVFTSTETLVGRLVSVMVSGGLLILSSAKVVESPPIISRKEIAPVRILPPSCRKACIFPL